MGCRRILVVAAALAVLAGAAPPTFAAQSTCRLDPNPPPPSERVVSDDFEGLDLNVLLPPNYRSSSRRYPVLYLLHARQYSANSWLARSDVEELSADAGVIVVMPDGGMAGWHVDYFDGSAMYERYHLGRLVPFIDRTYRTIADGAHRAIAGMSIGGHGAMHYAARHPDMFAAAGSFSGVVHTTIPEEPYAGRGDLEPRTDTGSPGSPRGPAPEEDYAPPGDNCQEGDAMGDRVGDAWHWHAHNPTDLATNLRGLGLYLMAGNGTPCGPEDASDPVLAAGLEPAALEDARYFDRALTAEGIEHTFDVHPCGLHNMVTATRGLHAFWPLMLRSFGRRTPARFDFRSTDRDFDVWDWTFRADPERAPEFLEVRGASMSGLTLAGSGKTTVVTGRLFAGGQRVRVSGALPALAQADPAGRLRVAADLGPPNQSPQFSNSDRSVVARAIRFEPEAAMLPPARGCAPGARVKIRMTRMRPRERRRSIAVTVNGERILVVRGGRAARTKKVFLSDLPRGRLTVTVRMRTNQKRTLRLRRTYPPCA